MTTAASLDDLRLRAPSSPVLRLVACGSVDDGKSTLIGRLLVETDSVPTDQLELRPAHAPRRVHHPR